MKILVIGATGHFGGRISRRLAGEPGTELIVSSRNLAAAQSLAADLRRVRPDSKVTGAALDQSSVTFREDLEALRPGTVIHTAGPYQGKDYRVAEACIDVGSHYLDLADGREFVRGFHRLHEAAQSRGVLLVSGASTLPGLSSAVIDSVRDRFDEIHGIATTIAPAHQTPRGVGTIAAVLSYCGKAFQVLEDGSWITRHGWQDLRRQRYPQLGHRLAGACDVPDIALMPEYVPQVRTVTFHAALEAKREQVALWLMAALVRLRLVRNWNRCVPAFRWLSDRMLGLGSDTGGMQMQISGRDLDGNKLDVTWNLVARQNHGPEIPCAPALILARKLARNALSLRGAFPCLGLISLQDFDEEVADLDIGWSLDEGNT